MKTLLVKCQTVQWQPDGLTIHTKQWLLGAGFLGAPPISLMAMHPPMGAPWGFPFKSQTRELRGRQDERVTTEPRHGTPAAARTQQLEHGCRGASGALQRSVRPIREVRSGKFGDNLWRHGWHARLDKSGLGKVQGSAAAHDMDTMSPVRIPSYHKQCVATGCQRTVRPQHVKGRIPCTRGATHET